MKSIKIFLVFYLFLFIPLAGAEDFNLDDLKRGIVLTPSTFQDDFTVPVRINDVEIKNNEMVFSIPERSDEDPVFLSYEMQGLSGKYKLPSAHQESVTNRLPDLYNNYPAFYYKQEDKGSYCLTGLGQVAMYLVAMTNGGGGGHKNKEALKNFIRKFKNHTPQEMAFGIQQPFHFVSYGGIKIPSAPKIQNNPDIAYNMLDVKMKGKIYLLGKTDKTRSYSAGMTNGGGGGHLSKSQWAIKNFQNDGGMWQAIIGEAHPAIQEISDTTTPEFWNKDCLASYYNIQPMN